MRALMMQADTRVQKPRRGRGTYEWRMPALAIFTFPRFRPRLVPGVADAGGFRARFPLMMRTACLLFLLAAAAAPGAEPKLPELTLTYAAQWRGFGLGDIVITLKREGGADCYRYESLTKPVGLVRMFYGKPRETSDFCVGDGRIVPRRFAFLNPKDEEASFSLEFDTDAGKVRDGRGAVRDIPPNAQDRFAIQQAVRLWVLAHLQAEPGETVEFAMVDEHRVKNYRFAITGHEQVEVPAGRFNALLVQRVDNPNRSTKFWLAPERDYMPVMVEQSKNGATELRMTLK